MNNQNQNASQGQSQYRGMQKTFQPSGFVNSVYKPQNMNQMSGSQSTSQPSFNTSQFKGNQPGHNSQWRSDSMTPFQQQSQFGTSQNQFSAPQNQFGSSQYQFRGQTQQAQQNQNQKQQGQFMRNYGFNSSN